MRVTWRVLRQESSNIAGLIPDAPRTTHYVIGNSLSSSDLSVRTSALRLPFRLLLLLFFRHHFFL